MISVRQLWREKTFADPLGLSAMCLFLALPLSAATQACRFNSDLLEFEGTPREQAKCLLRPVLKGARLGGKLQQLPDPLEQLVGQPVKFSKDRFRQFLRENNVNESDLGGSLEDDVSRTSDGARAEYFVIHDTSTPVIGSPEFPENINEAAWEGNNLKKWAQIKKTHVYINRSGQSVAAEDFSTPWRATKLELVQTGERARGRFLHVESIQPRRSEPTGLPGNDLIAPLPGFSDAQLKRLALVYLAASLRRRQWLIPAFHAVMDSGFKDGHDDPQCFDLQKWALFVGKFNDEFK
jgi:hypothetical protein